MITLSDINRKTVEDVLKANATDQPYKVVVFGSRATGKAKKYSDVDLALFGSSKIAPMVAARLAEAFEDSSLPYNVDVVDTNNTNAQLLEQIKLHGKELLTV
jgi:type I restriction enzyme S subunit